MSWTGAPGTALWRASFQLGIHLPAAYAGSAEPGLGAESQGFRPGLRAQQAGRSLPGLVGDGSWGGRREQLVALQQQ